MAEKRRTRQRSASPFASHRPSPPPNADLYLYAQEAALVSSSHDAIAAQVEYREGLEADGEGEGTAKTRMINWKGTGATGDGVWVDRYDALNLLDAVPPRCAETPSPTLSAGFSDLPSDSEEMFYFDADTREEIGREKKRRKMDEGREERLRALRVQEAAERVADEPDATQLAMMHKLHLTLLASPSPSLLEIRIMANYGADPRFSFLRKGGKWREIWETIRATPSTVEAPAKNQEQSSLVAAYGSDSESDDEAPEQALEPAAEAIEDPPPALEEITEEVTRRREAKAMKAREWAAKRQAARALAQGSAI